MNISELTVQVVVALICAGIATILLPRRVPGGLMGLILVGLVGVWLGDWAFALLQTRFNLSLPWLYWDFQGVLIIPAIIGSAIVLFLLTSLVRWEN
ncbi:GlsB/YeaQ/YmgE family stress response membrane protein [Leptolyngbya sp. AN02str]|uniref:GlsB/YeaQ/YmgE family stress response membrane protein n=1 Tax=Leptolyngbya sp. AN02str TaxID=3423363 RepID=UPI003D31228F